MLRKLLKYEFLATARVFGVCYLGLAALSILAGLSMKFPATSNNIVGALMLMAYVCMLAAVMLFTFLTIIRRFYKNLLGGEGYLMNTLPVRSWQLVTSKLIASLAWSAASLVMAALSFALLTIAASPPSPSFGKTLQRFGMDLPICPPILSLPPAFPSGCFCWKFCCFFWWMVFPPSACCIPAAWWATSSAAGGWRPASSSIS